MKTNLLYVFIIVFGVCRGFDPKLLGHIGNVIHGGSVGFGIQFRPLAPITGIIDHAKKFIPGHQQTSKHGDDQPPYQERPHQPNPGHYERPPKQPHYERPHHPNPEYDERPPKRPHYERPDSPHNQRPNRPHHERPDRPHYERPDRPHYERPDSPHNQRPNRPHHERPDKPHYERPVKPIDEQPHRPDNNKGPKQPNKEKPILEKEDPKKDDLPSWEDIGEYPEGDVPIEEIIQPRQRRPKRFIESKIYHVPVQFRSNAKPYKVQFKRETEKN